MEKEILVAWENLKKEIRNVCKKEGKEIICPPLFVDKEIETIDNHFYSK